MKMLGLFVLCCLCVGCQAETPEEQRIDILLLVIYEVAALALFVQTCAKAAFWPIFVLVSCLVLFWNAAFVQWWLGFRINSIAIAVALCIGIMTSHK